MYPLTEMRKECALTCNQIQQGTMCKNAHYMHIIMYPYAQQSVMRCIKYPDTVDQDWLLPLLRIIEPHKQERAVQRSPTGHFVALKLKGGFVGTITIVISIDIIPY